MKNLLTVILSLSLFSAIGQINPKTKWGNVSQEEIDYKAVDFDPDAAAVILYEEGYTLIENSFATTVYRRIKILNERGLEAANQEIQYYGYKNLHKINSIKAQTINFENGKAVTSAVDKNSFFDTNLNEFWSVKKFAFPNVKVGSIIEFEYKIEDNSNYIDAWRFQHEYPTLYSQYEISNRSSADFTSLTIGDEAIKLAKKYEKSGITKWILKNLPSYNSIPFLYNPEDASERISFQLKGYMKQGGDALGHTNKYQSVMTTWKELNKQISDEYIKFSNDGTGKEIAASIPDGKNDMETLENVFKYFKANYNWNQYYGFSPRKTNREVEKTKSGNSADLNLLMNTVLKSKDLKPELVLISTRRNGKPIGNYPYLGQFDSLVNVVKASDGTLYLIDASDMTFGLGYAPLQNYNYSGLLVDPQKEAFIELTPPISDYQSTQTYVVKDNHFALTRIEKRNGYFKQQDRKIPAGVIKYNPIANSLDLQTNEINSQTKDGEDQQMERIQSETIDFTNSNFIAFSNPLKEIISTYKLFEKDRERALEFDFPFHYNVNAILDIPEGFKAEIPAGYDAQSMASNKAMGYIQSAEIKNGKLILHAEFYLAKPVLSKNYNEIKSFFDKIIQDSNKSLLIKKQ